MARPLRIQFENACDHVTCRGNDRQSIFPLDADPSCEGGACFFAFHSVVTRTKNGHCAVSSCQLPMLARMFSS